MKFHQTFVGIIILFSVLITGCTQKVNSHSELDVPTMDLEPVMQISESDDLLLGAISNVVVDSEGDIILVDSNQRFVYAVSSTGDFIQQVGTRGSGPGEYQFPGMVFLGRDNSLHLLDWSTQSIINYKKEGGQWIFDSSFVPSFSEFGFFSMFYPIEDNEYIVVTSPNSAREEDQDIVVRKINTSNELVQDSLFTYPPNETFAVEMNDGMMRMAFTIPEVHRRGNFAIDYDGHAYYGWTESLDISRQEKNTNEFLPFIGINLPNNPFTSATRDSVLSEYGETLSDNNQALRDLESTFPDTKPVVKRFLIDDMSHVWVEVFTEEESTEWIVFNPQGEPVYKTTLPQNERLVALRHNQAYTTSNTDEGIPVVNIFEYNY